jgi:hypothetical protein
MSQKGLLDCPGKPRVLMYFMPFISGFVDPRLQAEESFFHGEADSSLRSE